MRHIFVYVLLTVPVILQTVVAYVYYTTTAVVAFPVDFYPPCDYGSISAEQSSYTYQAWQFNLTIPGTCRPEQYRLSIVEKDGDCFKIGYDQREVCNIEDRVKQANKSQVCDAVFDAGGYRSLADVINNNAVSYEQVEYRGLTGVEVGDVTVFGLSEPITATTYSFYTIVCRASNRETYLFLQSDCNSTQPVRISALAVIGDVAHDYCTSDSGLQGWEIALIVIGSILGFCLILLIVAIIFDACTATPEYKAAQDQPWTPPSTEQQQQPGTAYLDPSKASAQAQPQEPSLPQTHTPSSDVPVPPPVMQQSSSHSGWQQPVQYPKIQDQNVPSQPKV